MTDPHSLQRFIDAQESDYRSAVPPDYSIVLISLTISGNE
jgi:hypothetical protein